MEEFGPALVAAREAAGLTVEQVSAGTRLRAAVVRDLEAGHVASSGGPVYARGHVRSIAHVVGADPGPLLAALERATGAPVAAVAPVAPLRAPRAGALQVPRGEGPDRRAPRWGSAALAAATVLVVLLGIGVAGGREEAPGGPLVPAAGPEPAAAEAPVPAAAPAPAPAAPAAPVGSRLGIRAVAGDSWVRVRVGERTLFEGDVQQGSAARDFFDPQPLRLTVGNAGAVRLSCGGARVEPAGAPGEVKRFVCSASGLAPA